MRAVVITKHGGPSVLAVEERPNLPGTTEAGNWSRALPLALDQIEQDERVRGVARALRR